MDRRSIESEFLPAALEIEQTPPLPASRWILWSIMIFFGIGVAWCCIGEVNIVGVARGKIVPSGRVKVVQPFETGLVKAIHVAEGDRVASGDVLIALDDTKARADLDRLAEEHDALVWDQHRLHALLQRLQGPRGTDHGIPPRLRRHLHAKEASRPGSESPRKPWSVPDPMPAIVTARIHNEYTAYAAQRQAVNEEINRNRAERLEIARRIAQLDGTIPLLTERAEALETLEIRAMAPRASWLELEEERVGRIGEREVLRARLGVTDASHDNLLERRAILRAQTKSAWLAELTEAENRIASYAQEIRKAETRLREHQLRAPVAGTVQQLAVNTVGGVVTPAEKLMLIVPDEDALQVEAWVPNKDIGFVHGGQAAAIKVETFPFTKYGVIDGAIKHVSNDAIADESLGLVYLAQITMAGTTMRVDNKLVKLSPGMAVTVELDMGRRRLIEFLLTPLLRYKDEGLKER